MRTIGVLLMLAVAACGSDSDGSGEMALGGTLEGMVNGDNFTGKFGFAGMTNDDKPVIAIGEANLECGTDPSHDEIHGLGTIISNFEYEVTTDPQDDAYVSVFRYKGSHYQLGGGTSGVFQITDMTDTTVAGTIDYDSGSDDNHYAIHGDFIVTRCP